MPIATEVIKEHPQPVDLPDDIWRRIIGLATHVGDPEDLRMDGERFARSTDRNDPLNHRRSAIMLVSKRFYVRIFSLSVFRPYTH